MSRHPPHCHKLGFSTVEQAERTASIVAGLNTGKPAPVRLYECPRCGLLHFTSKSEEEVGSLASTVIKLTEPPKPLFAANEPTLPLEQHCARCNGPGAKFPLYSQLYHRRCRSWIVAGLPPAERQRVLNEWSLAGQAKTGNDEAPGGAEDEAV